MKVLHVSTPASWRGGEQQVAYLATALRDLNVEQRVLTPYDSELSARLAKAGVRCIHFGKRGFLDTGLAQAIRKACRDENISLIHAHDSRAHSGAVMAAALFGNKVPVVVSRRVDFPVSPNPFSRWKYNHPSVKRFLCVSDMIRQITAKDIREPRKLVVVYSGTDTTKYAGRSHRDLLRRELGIAPSSRIIGNLSALADHKDYPTFLRTARLLLDAGLDAHFVIAGKGPEEEKIRQLIAGMQLQERVHLLGFRKDVEEVMLSLDLFLMTSSTEGLGTIIIDAFAAAVPVVATRAGGIPEAITDGVNGLLCPVGDAEALKEAVLRIFGNPDLARRLIGNALERAGEFSFRATAQKTLAIYREVLQEESGRH